MLLRYCKPLFLPSVEEKNINPLLLEFSVRCYLKPHNIGSLLCHTLEKYTDEKKKGSGPYTKSNKKKAVLNDDCCDDDYWLNEYNKIKNDVAKYTKIFFSFALFFLPLFSRNNEFITQNPSIIYFETFCVWFFLFLFDIYTIANTYYSGFTADMFIVDLLFL